MGTVWKADIHSPATGETLETVHWGLRSSLHCHTYLQTCDQILTTPSPPALESPGKNEYTCNFSIKKKISTSLFDIKITKSRTFTLFKLYSLYNHTKN